MSRFRAGLGAILSALLQRVLIGSLFDMVVQVMAFVETSFEGARLREKQNTKMRFEIPQQKDKTLGTMFGFIEVSSTSTPRTCIPWATLLLSGFLLQCHLSPSHELLDHPLRGGNRFLGPA